MKTFSLIAFALVLSTSAFADLKPIGTPVPTGCGAVIQDGSAAADVVTAKTVCTVALAQTQNTGITIELNDGSTQLWTVFKKQVKGSYSALSLIYSASSTDGGKTWQFPANTRAITFVATLITHSDARGVTIDGTTPGNIEFDVKLEPVATTAGI